jgi:hypothetical protein
MRVWVGSCFWKEGGETEVLKKAKVIVRSHSGIIESGRGEIYGEHQGST